MEEGSERDAGGVGLGAPEDVLPSVHANAAEAETRDVVEPPHAELPSRRFPMALRLLGSVGLAALVALMVVFVMPASVIKSKVPSWVFTTGEALQMQQYWGMFSPDPPTLTLELEGVLTYADGKVLVIHPPTGNALVTPLFTERWRKFSERVYPVSSNPFWPEAARWMARTHLRDGKEPVKVALRRTWIVTPIGKNLPVAQWEHRNFEFFSIDLKTGQTVFNDPELGGKGTAS